MNLQSIENILKTMSILYIEADKTYKKGVSEALEIKVKKVFVASTLKVASDIYNTNNIDIIITDINLDTDGDGIKLIKSLRDINRKIPIIVISNSKDVFQITKLIKFNLVDYIFKPIDLKQLREALNRSVERILYNGVYVIYFKNDTNYNIQKNILLRADREMSLTHNERLLLNTLVVNQNCILSKEEIKAIVWENSYEVSDTAFKSLINRLRTKVGKDSIKNSSGNGYILNLEDE